jgi:hypothetical protein
MAMQTCRSYRDTQWGRIRCGRKRKHLGTHRSAPFIVGYHRAWGKWDADSGWITFVVDGDKKEQ